MQTSKNELVRIVEHYMRICEKQAQGRATYSLKCLTTYEGNPAAEVYSTPIGKNRLKMMLNYGVLTLSKARTE